jgi:hypothetical protein
MRFCSLLSPIARSMRTGPVRRADCIMWSPRSQESLPPARRTGATAVREPEVSVHPAGDRADQRSKPQRRLPAPWLEEARPRGVRRQAGRSPRSAAKEASGALAAAEGVVDRGPRHPKVRVSKVDDGHQPPVRQRADHPRSPPCSPTRRSTATSRATQPELPEGPATVHGNEPRSTSRSAAAAPWD